MVADNDSVTTVTSLTKHKLDILSDSSLAVKTVAQGVGDVIDTDTRLEFLEVYLIVLHESDCYIESDFEVDRLMPAISE